MGRWLAGSVSTQPSDDGLPDCLAVQWGSFSIVEAERRLLITALAHPGNQRFTMLSESCVFLYPPAVVWLESFSDPRSRVNACTDPGYREQRRVQNYRCASVKHSPPLSFRNFPAGWSGESHVTNASEVSRMFMLAGGSCVGDRSSQSQKLLWSAS